MFFLPKFDFWEESRQKRVIPVKKASMNGQRRTFGPLPPSLPTYGEYFKII